jgi:hypothetical protein
MSGGLPAHSEILYGLFYGNIPELQFASPMAYTHAKVPSMPMGIPTLRAREGKTQKAVSRILENLGEEIPLAYRLNLTHNFLSFVLYSSQKPLLWGGEYGSRAAFQPGRRICGDGFSFHPP